MHELGLKWIPTDYKCSQDDKSQEPLNGLVLARNALAFVAHNNVANLNWKFSVIKRNKRTSWPLTPSGNQAYNFTSMNYLSS